MTLKGQNVYAITSDRNVLLTYLFLLTAMRIILGRLKSVTVFFQKYNVIFNANNSRCLITIGITLTAAQ